MSTFYLLPLSEAIFTAAEKAGKIGNLGLLLLDKQQPDTIGLDGDIFYAQEVSLTDDFPNIQHLLRPLLNDDEFAAQFYKENWTRIPVAGNDAEIAYLTTAQLYEKLQYLVKFWNRLAVSPNPPTLEKITFAGTDYLILDEASTLLLLEQIKQLAQTQVSNNSESFKDWSGNTFNKYAVASLLQSINKLFKMFGSTAIAAQRLILIAIV